MLNIKISNTPNPTPGQYLYTMRYIVLNEPGDLQLEEKDEPRIDPGHALIRIKKVGICGTDLHAFHGDQPFFSYPRILGHELSGEVVETDNRPADIAIGDRVIPIPYLHCRRCVACRNGQTNCCENLQVLGVHTDGGMQEYITLPSENLLRSDAISEEEMAIVEPLAIGRHALVRAQVKPDQKVVVVGCGPIGIALAKQAQVMGADVTVLDTVTSRLEFAGNDMGIQKTILVDSTTVEKLRELTDGDLADVVFDATGNKKALESGIQYMRAGGTYVLVGLLAGDLSFHHPEIHRKETTLLCSRNATRSDFLEVIEFLSSGVFPTNQYITHRTHPEGLLESFPSWCDPKTGVMKAVLTF